MACDNNQIIQALEAISTSNANDEGLEAKLKHLLDQTSKTTPASNNQESASNDIAKNPPNKFQPSPRPKSSSISTVDLVSGPLTSATLTTATSSSTAAAATGTTTCTTSTKAEISTSQVIPTSPTKQLQKSTASTSSRPPPPHRLNRSYTTIDRDKINKAGSFLRSTTSNTNNSSQPGSPKILSLIRVSLKYVLFFKISTQ